MNRSTGFRLSALFAATVVTLAVFLLHPFRGSTHEPITTNVRFNKEVVRILQKNCLGCHAPGKIKSDIDLSTYEVARPWAKAIKEEILEKRMPPYQAVKGFGRFSHDYGLSQREIDLLVSWVEGGAPKGEMKDLPRPDAENASWELGKPDLILTPLRPSKVTAEGSSTSCIVLDPRFTEDRWVLGVEFKPGNERVVHSAMISLVRPSAGRVAAAASLCGSSAKSREELLTSWVPGQSVARLPAEAARLIPRGSKVLVRINYQGMGEPAMDSSSVGIFLAREMPEKQVSSLALSSTVTNLGPSEKPVRVTAALILAFPADAVAIRPLLFPYATSIEVTANRPDGSREVLIWAKDRRYDWSPEYWLRKPVRFPAGTRIEAVAYLDNSADNPNNPYDPPRAVRFAQPLCEIFLAQSAPLKVASLIQR